MAVSALVARWETGHTSPTRVSLSSNSSLPESGGGSVTSESLSPSEPSTPDSDRKASLIDLRDWVVELESVDSNHSGNNLGTPLIQLDAPPPLPPRKPSLPSLKAPVAAKPPLPKRPSQSNLHSYPPPGKLDLPSKPTSPGHAPTSSVSSFHSISLSSDPATPNSTKMTFPENHNTGTSEGDSVSLDESFENVSNTSYGSPITTPALELDKTPQKPTLPPRLPQRPSSLKSPPPPPSKPASLASPRSSVPPSPIIRASSGSSSSAAQYNNNRRAPPPPPSRTSTTASDRSSIISVKSTASYLSSASNGSHRQSFLNNAGSSKTTALSRPTPVPSAAKKRYESVFNSNVIQRRKCMRQHNPAEVKKARKSAGWRGLSVDLIGVDESSFEEVVDEQVGPEERLSGRVVRGIWSRSKLEKSKLREIWNECDTSEAGSLDRESFTRGMWRIDEELRRIQLRAPGLVGVRGPAAFSGTGSLKIKQPLVLPKPKPKPILH